MLRCLANLVGGRQNALRGIAEGLPLIGLLAAVYALAMLAPMIGR